MKRLKTLFTLYALAVCSIYSAWARTAPVFPSDQTKTLESGNTYYLYNPVSDRFVYQSGTSVYANTSGPSSFVITNVEGDVYTLQVSGSNYYMICSGSSVSASSSSSSSYLQYRKFRIDATEGGYTIQRNYDHNEAYYVGNATGNSNVGATFTEGNIVWQLYDENGYNAILRYRAKKALYDALVSADGYNISFAIEDYEALYANESATNDELNAAASSINDALIYTERFSSSDSEYPIYLEPTGGTLSFVNDGTYRCTSVRNGSGGLKSTLVLDQDATVVYNYGCYNHFNFSFRVFVDGELYQVINNYEGESNISNRNSDQMYFVELSAGNHTIEWVASSNDETNESKFRLYNIAAYKIPEITVNLTQAGSLGTEVLYQVDHVKDVRKLVIKGKMNSDDWTRVNMMTGLFELDLTETDVTSLPRLYPSKLLHKLKLPSGLTEIQESALQSTNLEEITFPMTLKTIGKAAFRYSRIKEAILPETVTSIGEYAFADNESLINVEWSANAEANVDEYAFSNDPSIVKVVWPAKATVIPQYCFYEDYQISDFNLPEGIKTIGQYAFYNNYHNNYQLPSTLTSIGIYAFYNNDGIETLSIPGNCSVGYYSFCNCDNLKSVKIGEGVSFVQMYLGSYSEGPRYSYATFYGCDSLESIEFPTSFSSVTATDMLYNCTSLKKVTFKSPTMVGGSQKSSFFSGLGNNIMVYVPSYLVNTYKLDPYWYNYNIMGFSTADVTEWSIKNDLTFYSQDRFEGTPDVTVFNSGSWTINGELSQNIKDFQTLYYTTSANGEMGSASKVISNCDYVRITGSYKHRFYAYNTIHNGSGRWHFISLPFDIKVSDITCSNNALFAIRYYDGANRAANGTGGNWKDYADDAVIPAGTGFIIQVSTACWIDFYSLDNESKQNAVSNKLFVKALEANDSEQSSNKGWNLVGNPWQSYYNIHKLNFTAPITVYDGYNRKYSAYSVIDDDYAILPNQAFFVQCPDDVSTISFPVDGRQLTSVIESQNGVKSMVPQVQSRWLADIELSNGDMSDKTRVVLNEQASLDYETSCDASKFFESGTACPQIYTLEGIDSLAINERPYGSGTVKLGIRVAEDGTFTLSAPRNQFDHILLIDHETGAETDLSLEEYTFSANAGTDDSRFELCFDRTATGIENVSEEISEGDAIYYNLSGQRISQPQKGIYIVNGKKVMIK